MGKINIWGAISILIPSVLIILILNFYLGLIPLDKIEGLPIILPIFLCPFGAVIGFFSYKVKRDKLSFVGMILNIPLFLFPTLYNLFGTLVFGV